MQGDGNQPMKELIVISGKGGTGKTSLMAAFASLAEKKVLCDADVDAADLHLIMNPNVTIFIPNGNYSLVFHWRQMAGL